MNRKLFAPACVALGLALPGCAAPSSAGGPAASGPAAAGPSAPAGSPSAAPKAGAAPRLSAAEAAASARKISAESEVNEQELSNAMLTALFNAYVSLPYGVGKLGKDEAARLRLVSRLGPVLFGVVESAAFREIYAKRRAEEASIAEVERPTPPRTAKQIHERRLAALSEGVSGIEAVLKQAPPSMRKTIETQLAEMKKEQAKARNDTAQDERMAAAEKAAYDEATASYPGLVKAREEQIAKKLAKWPEDPRALVTVRLKEFLAISSTIDWSARTTSADGRVRFVDPDLETRDPFWKLCFRAGKPTVDAARAVAQDWLDRTNPR